MAREGSVGQLRATHQIRRGTPALESIEAGRVWGDLDALDQPVVSLDTGVPVPLRFPLTLGCTRRPRPTRGTAVNAGNPFEVQWPVRKGDVIEVRRERLDVIPKQGRSGPRYPCGARTTYTIHRVETVAVSHRAVPRWNFRCRGSSVSCPVPNFHRS